MILGSLLINITYVVDMFHVVDIFPSILTSHIYGVATLSRFLRIIGLFCRISSLLQGSFAKETYNLKEPTDRSHPIAHYTLHHEGKERKSSARLATHNVSRLL